MTLVAHTQPQSVRLSPAGRSLLLALRASSTGVLRVADKPGTWTDGHETWSTGTVKGLVRADLLDQRRWQVAFMTPAGRKRADSLALVQCVEYQRTSWASELRTPMWCVLAGSLSTDASQDRTRCGGVIILRTGSEMREPTCPECRRALGFPVTTRSP